MYEGFLNVRMCGFFDVGMGGLVDVRIYLGVIEVAFEVEVAFENGVSVSNGIVYI